MSNEDIVFNIISEYFMDLSNDCIKVKNEEAMIKDLPIKICKALKIKEGLISWK